MTALRITGRAEALGRRERVVLATLAVQRPEVATHDQLANALWPGGAPPTSAKVVQGCVSRLRGLLGADAITTLDHGYRLDASVVTEADAFTQRVARGQELLQLGQADRAAYALDEALREWSGDPYVELAHWGPAEAASARLREEQAIAEESHVDALLLAGNVAVALPLALTLVSEAPFREHRWAQLALAHYRAGNQAEALEALRTCRTTLRDELGIDPGVEITELEESVLRQDVPATPTMRDGAATDDCPWPGLAAYGPDDAQSFFGRDIELAAALAVLATRGVLAVVGPSGVGKSSFVGAGIVATLRARGRSVHALVPAGRVELPDCDVLVVDQAEEIFGLAPTVRKDLLRELTGHPGQVVLAMRADRLADVGSYPTLARILEQGLFILGGLSAEGLSTAIQRPAAQHGLLVEPGLVDLFLRDLEGSPSALPQFSHALAETWSRREGRTLTVAGYRTSGGVGGALARTAEDVHDALPDSQRPVLRSLMLRLVVVDTTERRRARVPRRDLNQTHLMVLDRLVRARLVTVDDAAVTVTHEALIDGWPRLRGWLDEDVEGRRIFQHLTASARAWEDLDRPESELYRGVRLAGAVAWSERADVELAPVERAFLEASSAYADAEATQLARQVRRQARTNRLLRTGAAGIAAALAVAVVLGVLAVRQGRRADQKAGEAEGAALAQTAVAVGASALDTDDPQLALLLVAAAQQLSPSEGTAFNLAAAVADRPELIRTVTVRSGDAVARMAVAGDRLVAADRRHEVRTFTEGLVPDAAYQAGDSHLDTLDVPVAATPAVVVVAAGRSDASAVRLLDPATLAELPQQLVGVPTGVEVQGLAVSSDGHYLAASFGNLASSSDGPIGGVDRAFARVWDLDSRQQVGRQVDPPLPFTRVALSDDGATLFTSNPVAAYDVATGRLRWQGNEAWTGEVDARGRVLASFTEDGTAVQLLNSESGLTRTTLTGQTGVLQDVAFAPDGLTLAATSADGMAVVWDTRTGRTLHRFDTGAGAATGVSYSSDARTLYVAKPLTREVQGWDLSGDRRFLSRIGFSQIEPYGTGSVELSPGATRIARGGWRPDPAEATLSVFDTRTGVEVHPELIDQSWNGGGGWSPDGRQIVTGYGGGWVQLINGVSGRETGRRQALPADLVDASFAGDDHVVVADVEGNVGLLSTRPLARAGEVVKLPETAYSLVGSADGHTALVLTAGTDLRPDRGIEVRRWYQVDLTSGTIVDHGDLTVRNGTVVALSPDGLSAAVGGLDGELEVLDMETGAPVRPAVSGVRGDIVSVSFSPDGSQILTTSTGPDVAVWDASTGALRSRFPLPVGQQVTSVEMREDGVVTVAAISGDTFEWDPSPEAAVEHACSVAGRDLTEQEWRDAFGELAYRSTC